MRQTITLDPIKYRVRDFVWTAISIVCIASCLMLMPMTNSFSQGTWTPKANYKGSTGWNAVWGPAGSFSIGTKGYIGGAYAKDFWQWDQATDVWTQMAPYAGAADATTLGFSIGTKGYFGTGMDQGNSVMWNKDFWEYDPAANVWTKKADYPGGNILNAVGFSIGSKGYIGCGFDSTFFTKRNDFWQYDPASMVNGLDANGNPMGEWIKKANYPGYGTICCVGFSIGAKGYVGTGMNASFCCDAKDFWEYNPANDQWTKQADFPGTARDWAYGFSICNKGYIGGGGQGASPYGITDFWEYTPGSNTWAKMADHGCFGGVQFAIGCRGYTGIGDEGNSFWEYRPSLTVSSSQTPITCYGGKSTVTLTVSGGCTGPLSYSWAPSGGSSAVATGLAAGTYTVTVTEVSGCSPPVTQTITITSPSALSGAVTSTGALCSGQCSGSASISTSGGTPGYSYSWSNGKTSTSVTGLCANNYTCTITDANGCTKTQSVTITQPPFLTAVPAVTSPPCAGGTGGAAIQTSGGTPPYSYAWSSGQSSSASTGLPAGSYNVMVTDAQGCVGGVLFTITDPAPLTAIATATSAVCGDNGSTSVSVSGGSPGYSYSWNTTPAQTTQTATGLAAANYTIAITDAQGCSATKTVAVTFSGSVTAMVSPGSSSLCAGDTAVLTASGGSAYLWSSGETTASITLSPSASASYSVVVSLGLCSDTGAAMVTLSPAVIALASTSSSTLCYGSSATLGASPSGASYQWVPASGLSCPSCPDPVASPSASTTYSVTVTSASGCFGTSTVSLTVDPTIVTTVTPAAICAGDSALLSATGGGSYTWNTGASTSSIYVSPPLSSSYTVTVTKGVCWASAVATVSVTAAVTASISGSDTICSGESTQLIGSGGGNYLWNGSQSTQTITVSPSATTAYTLLVTSGSCTDTATYTVSVQPVPTAGAGMSVTIIQGQSASLTASGGISYVWSGGQTSPLITVTPSVTTLYCVTVTDVQGCADSACVTVTVEPLDCSGGGELYLPNAFSPNGDGENDLLKTYYGSYDCIKTFELVIYSNWGEEVFRSDDPQAFWDGAYAGMRMNAAVFMYYLRATLVSGEEISQKGNINLIR